MKIDRVEVVPLRARLSATFKFGTTDRSISPNVVVVIHCEDLIGYGEACPVPAFTAETPQSVVDVIDTRVAPLLVGADPLNRGRLMADVSRVLVGHHFARAAVEMALLDLAGKIAGVPGAVLLGGAWRDRVEVHGSVGWEPDPARVVDNALVQQESFHWLKLYVGRGELTADLRMLTMVREACRDSVRLMVDVNGMWSLQQYRRALSTLRDLNIELIEQPVAPHLMRLLPPSIGDGPAVCADESLFGVLDVAGLSAQGNVNVVNVGQAKLGGPERAKTIAELATVQGLDVMVGSVVELSISNAAGLQLAAALPQLPYPSYLMGPLKYATRLGSPDLVVEDGHVAVPPGPGLGLDIDLDAVRELDAREPHPETT